MSVPTPGGSADTVCIVNGHEVSLSSCTGDYTPPDASGTDWVIVKFDQFVDYDLKQELRQKNLEVYEHIGDNAYLCKYSPGDLTPISNSHIVSYLALYPENVVPMADIDGLTTDSATTDTASATESTKMPFVIVLHPNPKQSPEQVLDLLRNSFGAEHLDEDIAGDTIRVKLDPATIPEVSKIDSIRTIANVRERQPFSVHQRAILKFTSPGISSNYKGNGEIVHIADTGFDNGDKDNVHPAFTGRVLATTTSVGATVPADQDGHGTHVAGSVLGDLYQGPGTDLSNARGTAPEAKLISIALNFANFPTTQSILTQDVPGYGPPIVMNNSWGNIWTGSQAPYGPDDARVVDQVMYNNSAACIMFAAGNDGRNVGANGKQQQVGNFASAKNCITVGASYSDRPLDAGDFAYQAGGTVHSPSELTVFSSTGPTLDGRIAPDVVAPGAVILSTRSRSITPASLQKYLSYFGTPGFDNLLFMDGTSQATPAVTGCVAVLRAAFRAHHSATPTGALLKALIVHGAVDLVGTQFTVISQQQAGPQTSKQYTMTAAPNPFQGFGLVDISNSLLPVVGETNGHHGFVDSAKPSGPQQRIHRLSIVEYASKLIVTLNYTDLPGNALQNQITLSVKLSDGTTLSPLAPTDPMGRNIAWQPSNVAKIVAANPPAGHADIILDVLTGEQNAKFAVVWTVS